MMTRRKYLEKLDFEIRLLTIEDKAFVNKFSTGGSMPEKGIGDYLKSNEIFEDIESGEGVSYIVVRNIDNEPADVIAYFTLVSSSLPFFYRYEDEGEWIVSDSLCDIPAVRINMFGVDVNYQDVFYRDDDADMPVAAWVYEAVVALIDEMSKDSLGIKAIYLHTLPSAKDFYCRNGMIPIDDFFYPLKGNDDELEVLYTPIRKINGLNTNK